MMQKKYLYQIKNLLQRTDPFPFRRFTGRLHSFYYLFSSSHSWPVMEQVFYETLFAEHELGSWPQTPMSNFERTAGTISAWRFKYRTWRNRSAVLSL